jgi:hypothetical protein
MSQPDSQAVALYTLSDPDTGKVMYAGQSIEPDKRKAHHVNPLKPKPTRRREWTAKLAAEGKSPVFEIQKVVPMADANKAESELIQSLVENGEAELNIKGAQKVPKIECKFYLTPDIFRRVQIKSLLAGVALSTIANEILDKSLPHYEINEVPKP